MPRTHEGQRFFRTFLNEICVSVSEEIKTSVGSSRLLPSQAAKDRRQTSVLCFCIAWHDIRLSVASVKTVGVFSGRFSDSFMHLPVHDCHRNLAPSLLFVRFSLLNASKLSKELLYHPEPWRKA